MLRKFQEAQKAKEAREQEMLRKFQIMDVDGSGTISKEELKLALEALGEAASDTDIEYMVASADPDGDGMVSFDDFKFAIRSYSTGHG